MSRYYGRRKKVTSEKMYKELLDGRDVKHIRHFETPVLSHPTVEQRREMTEKIHVWTVGDRYYKLAHTYYGDSTKWWLVALFNQKPTEFHLNAGDVIYIPTPLDAAMYRMGY